MLSDKALQEFKQLYLEEFGDVIDDAKAAELAINLLTLFDHIYRPLKKGWLSEAELIQLSKKQNKNIK